MVKMVDKDQPHIWYEQCHSCFGVYFDAGEFNDYKHRSLFDYIGDIFVKERK
jgi:Zn-finger nucleic acid-binding protein